MNRTAITWRMYAIAAAVLVLIAVAMPASAQAQLKCGNCATDVIRVYATDDIPCTVPVCIGTPSGGLPVCYKAEPGKEIQIPCIEGGTIYIRDCDGRYVPITADCAYNIPLGNGCCVNACLYDDGQGCYIVKIGRSLQNCGCTTD